MHFDRLVIGRVAIIKSGRISNHIGMTAGALSLSIKQVRSSGLARISAQGEPKKSGGGHFKQVEN